MVIEQNSTMILEALTLLSLLGSGAIMLVMLKSLLEQKPVGDAKIQRCDNRQEKSQRNKEYDQEYIDDTGLHQHDGRAATWKRFVADFEEIYGRTSDALKRWKLIHFAAEADKKNIQDWSNRLGWTYEIIKARLNKRYKYSVERDLEFVRLVNELVHIENRSSKLQKGLILLRTLRIRRTEGMPAFEEHEWTRKILRMGGDERIWNQLEIKDFGDYDKVAEIWEMETRRAKLYDDFLADNRACRWLVSNKKKEIKQKNQNRKDPKEKVTMYRCYNCGKERHISKYCQFEKKGFKCYRCGGERHLARNCTSI